MKRCSVCRLELPEERFYPHSRNKGGLTYHCRDCDKLSRDRYAARLAALPAIHAKDKTCSSCGLNRPIDEFGSVARSRDRHSNRCKVCVRTAAAGYKRSPRDPNKCQRCKSKTRPGLNTCQACADRERVRYNPNAKPRVPAKDRPPKEPRKMYSATPEGRKQWWASYSAKNRDKLNARQRAWWAANTEKARTYGKKWRDRNSESVRSKSREKGRTLRLDPVSGARARAYQAEWKRLNPGHGAKTCAIRRIRLAGSDSVGVGLKGWREIRETFCDLCAYCQRPVRLTRDHVEPIARGGKDDYENIVPACQSCNSSKGDKTLLKWLLDGGPLVERMNRKRAA